VQKKVCVRSIRKEKFIERGNDKIFYQRRNFVYQSKENVDKEIEKSIEAVYVE